MDVLIQSGVVYELAGLCYFLFYLSMSRRSVAARYSRRSRVLTLLAAIVLVGSVVAHYGQTAPGIVAMLAFAIGALVSTFADLRAARH